MFSERHEHAARTRTGDPWCDFRDAWLEKRRFCDVVREAGCRTGCPKAALKRKQSKRCREALSRLNQKRRACGGVSLHAISPKKVIRRLLGVNLYVSYCCAVVCDGYTCLDFAYTSLDFGYTWLVPGWPGKFAAEQCSVLRENRVSQGKSA